MPIVGINRFRVYEVFGLPAEGSDQLIVTTIAHMPPTMLGTWEPTYTHTTIQNVRADIDGRLVSTSADHDTRILMWLSEWDKVVISPLLITRADNGVEGTLVDDKTTREIIRKTLGDSIGVWVPIGGWSGEVTRVFPSTGYPHGGGGRY